MIVCENIDKFAKVVIIENSTTMETKACKEFNAYLKEIADLLQGIVRQKHNFQDQMNEIKIQYTESKIDLYYRKFDQEVFNNMNLYEDNSLIRSYIFNYMNNCIESPINDSFKHQLIATDFELAYFIGLHKAYVKMKESIVALIKQDYNSSDYSTLQNKRLLLKQLKSEGKFPFSIHVLNIESAVDSLQPQLNRKGEIRKRAPKGEASAVFKKKTKLVEKLVWMGTLDEFIDFFNPALVTQSMSLNNDFDSNKILAHLKEAIFIPGTSQNRFRPADAPIKKRVYWHDTPQKFVPFFNNALQNKKFSLRSSFSVTPIVNELTNVFDIIAKRKAGVVSSDTLNSYFKKFKAGDPF